MAIRRTYAEAELTDGTTLGPERIMFADKAQFERTAKARSWKISDEILAQGFLSWHALKRVGAHSLSYEDYLDQLADVSITTDADADGEADPTTAGTPA